MRKACPHSSVWRTSVAPATGLKGLRLKPAPKAQEEKAVAFCYTCGTGFLPMRRTPTRPVREA